MYDWKVYVVAEIMCGWCAICKPLHTSLFVYVGNASSWYQTPQEGPYCIT